MAAKKKEVIKPKKVFLYESNKDCPYKRIECGTDLLCLICVYDVLIKRKEWDTADEIYIIWQPLFDKHNIERVGNNTKTLLVERLQHPEEESVLPTKGQFVIIKMLAEKNGIDMPIAHTKLEAIEIINQLKQGNK